jgi:fluoroacetyl-CoA thioesterase
MNAQNIGITLPSELSLGLIGEVSLRVTEQDTAAKWRSGLVAAFATPALVGLTENASVCAIEKYLNEDQTSVGVEVNVRHLAATPVGMVVKAKAELVEIDGRRLGFKVEAWDEKEKVCEGSHSRVLVDRYRFTDKLAKKSKADR